MDARCGLAFEEICGFASMQPSLQPADLTLHDIRFQQPPEPAERPGAFVGIYIHICDLIIKNAKRSRNIYAIATQ